MNIKMNLKSTEQYDAVVTDGQLQFVNGDDYVVQKAKQLLLTMKQDWFRDTEFGIPWFQTIFQKPFNLEKTKGILRSFLLNGLSSFGVLNVRFSNVTLKASKRTLSLEVQLEMQEKVLTLKEVVIV